MSNALSTDMISDLVNRFKPVPVSEMEKYRGGGNDFNHPIIDPTPRTVALPRGRECETRLTIADANAGKFFYAFLDPQTLERYSGSFRVVTKDCEAAKANDLSIPDKEFNGQGVIYRQGLIYCYCSWEYHKALQDETEDLAIRSMASLMPGEAASEKDASGRSIATVTNTKMESQLVVKADEPKSKKG